MMVVASKVQCTVLAQMKIPLFCICYDDSLEYSESD